MFVVNLLSIACLSKILTINKADGTTENVEEVVSFRFNDTDKHYLVYTKNETDDNGNVTVYITEVATDNSGTRFLGVASDEEWSKIKEVLRELAKRV